MPSPQQKKRSRKPRTAPQQDSDDLASILFPTISGPSGRPKSRPQSTVSEASRAHRRTGSNTINNANGHSRTTSRQNNQGRTDSRASTRGYNAPASVPPEPLQGVEENGQVDKTIDATSKYYMNYGVVALHDNKLGQIFYTTTVGNIYIYDDETGEWNKSYCQGPLFLYSRVTNSVGEESNESNGISNTSNGIGGTDYGECAPYALIALNRLSTTNFWLAITPKSIAEKKGVEPVGIYRDGNFLIVHSPEDITYCIYLYKDEERQSILDGIEWCLNVDM